MAEGFGQDDQFGLPGFEQNSLGADRWPLPAQDLESELARDESCAQVMGGGGEFFGFREE